MYFSFCTSCIDILTNFTEVKFACSIIYNSGSQPGEFPLADYGFGRYVISKDFSQFLNAFLCPCIVLKYNNFISVHLFIQATLCIHVFINYYLCYFE